MTASPPWRATALLAAGSGDIYQMAHVFRGSERGRWHNAEFTLIEWYRLGWSMRQLMGEVAELALTVLAAPRDTPLEYLRYAQAFERWTGADPLTAPDSA